MPKVNRDHLFSYLVRTPPISEQRRIVAILDEAFEGIATAKANAEKNLQNARALFDAQLQRKFCALDACWPRRTFDSLAEETLIGLTRSAREQGDDLRCKYVKMNNISSENRFNSTRLVSVNATDAEVQKYRLKTGDFLFNTRNSHELVGKSCIYECADEGDVVFNNNIMRVRFHAEIDSQFMLYAFSYKCTIVQIESMKSGTTNVAALYYRDLATLELPTPDGPTQRQISKMLSTMHIECDRLADIQQQKLSALADLKNSLLHQAFTGQLTAKKAESLADAVM
jgi:type I restriction enzyme S subunit